MLIVRKNQLFNQEWQVYQYIKGEFIGVVSGMLEHGIAQQGANEPPSVGRSNAGGMIRRAPITLKL